MVRDFGSLNGTFRNGELIGQRPKDMSIEEARKQRTNEFPLKSGDVLGISRDCEITIHISLPKYCASCLGEVESDVYKNQAGQAICGTCNAAQKKGAPKAAPKQITCEICDSKLDDRQRQLSVCADCYSSPEKALNHLLKRAQGADYALKDYGNMKKISCLGKGGMGEVWSVADQAGNKYALKFMLPQAAASEVGRKTFLREAQMMVQLKHKNIVQAHKFGQLGGMYYILMEMCEGGSLEQFIRKNGGRLSVDTAIDIFSQYMDGLIYTHSAPVIATNKEGEPVSVKGVVHRDLKPANIFLSGSASKPTVKVADFGLAKAFEIAGLSGHTFTGAVAGTPVFMPRQQVMDYRYSSPAVDVWAAAATLYYMLTGYFPKDFSEGDALHCAISTSAVPILKRNSRVPKRLAAVIDQALVEQPTIGIQSAVELKKQVLGAV